MVVAWNRMLLGVLFVAAVLAADLDETCISDDDCTESVPHSTCFHQSSVCDRGVCQCLDSHRRVGNNTCLKRKAYNENCNVDNDVCDATLSCTLSGNDRRCLCTDTDLEYNMKLGMCTGKKAYGDACVRTGDCFMTLYGSVVCEPDETTGVTTCACNTGYKMENNRCVLPSFGDFCDVTVGCRLLSAPDNSTSMPVCERGQCSCRSDDQEHTVIYQQRQETLCYKTGEFDRQDGASCFLSNQCESRLCGYCVNGGMQVCQAAYPVSGSTVVQINVMMTSLISVLWMLALQ